MATANPVLKDNMVPYVPSVTQYGRALNELEQLVDVGVGQIEGETDRTLPCRCYHVQHLDPVHAQLCNQGYVGRK